jgi:hypothetical protein
MPLQCLLNVYQIDWIESKSALWIQRHAHGFSKMGVKQIAGVMVFQSSGCTREAQASRPAPHSTIVYPSIAANESENSTSPV